MNKWAFTTIDLFILCGLYWGIGIKTMYFIDSWKTMTSLTLALTLISMTFFILISIIVIKKGRIKQAEKDG